MKFEDNVPTAQIKIRSPLGEKEIAATIDTGAFKSLIPLDICSELGLHLKEVREVRGVGKKPTQAKIFWAELIFAGQKAADSVIGFDLPVDESPREYEKALIGRDVLANFRLLIDFKKKEISFEDC